MRLLVPVARETTLAQLNTNIQLAGEGLQTVNSTQLALGQLHNPLPLALKLARSRHMTDLLSESHWWRTHSSAVH